MNNHLKPNLTIILLLLQLFVTGCSSIRGGAASGRAMLVVEDKSEDHYTANFNSNHSPDLQSPTVKEIEAFDPVSQENPGGEISSSKRKTESEKIMISIQILKKDQIDNRRSISDYQNAVVTIPTSSGHGTGFIISEDGYVLTNQHVVNESRFVDVKLVTGRYVTGEVIRTDAIGDVALIKLETDVYPYVLLGNSSLLDLGEEVYAIGAPLEEELSQTVTNGIVSSFRMEKGLRYIQSDMTIRGGDSGGPLVSLQNGVVGICTAGNSFHDSNTSGGLNQIIPIEDAITMLNINDEEIAIQDIEGTI